MRKKQRQCKGKGYLCFLFPCAKVQVSHLLRFQNKIFKIERGSDTILGNDLVYLRIARIHTCQPSTTTLLEAVSLVLKEIFIYILQFSHILILCNCKCFFFNFRVVICFEGWMFNFMGNVYRVENSFEQYHMLDIVSVFNQLKILILRCMEE